MKTTLLTCLCSATLAATLFAQEPTATPAAPATATPAATAAAAIPSPAASPSAAASATAKADERNDLESRIGKKVKHGVNISFGEDKHKRDRDRDSDDDDSDIHVGASDIPDSAYMAIPIVGIIFSTLFGAPVLVVGLILFFSYWKSRSLHRTVRMMVEKGQPVPEALFAVPHSPARARSDMRRGVVLIMIGLGLTIFLGAVNNWEDGVWAIGIIPFLIGAGYLLVWQLEGAKRSTDNTPRVP